MSIKALALGGAALGGLLTLATLPAVLAPPTGPTVTTCVGTMSSNGEAIAATIRQLESGGDYTARAPGSSASGAYQFLDSTWADYGGYPRAYLAPPTVQDAKAAEYIAAVLTANDDDVTSVPVTWYIGHVPPPSSPEWDTVPAPGAGNRLTPRQYQAKWMDTYRTYVAEHEGRGPAPRDTGPAAAACADGSGEPLPGGWSLLGPRDLLDATGYQIHNPHHDYPAWDWTIPTGTPIYAMRAGTVTSISTNPYNCYGQATCAACGLGTTVTDDHGVEWTYCHGSALLVEPGDTVAAGQQILDSGNTGNSTGPHLHLAIRANGAARCPQPLLASLHATGAGLDPKTLPTSGCRY